MKKVIKILGLTGAGLLLLFAGALLVFYHLLQVGEFRSFLIGEFERRTRLKVGIGEAEVQMGWVVGVSFRDFVLSAPDSSRPAIAAPKILIRVALLPLLEQRLSFYGLQLYQPTIEIARDEQGKIPLLESVLNLPFQYQEARQFSLDLREIKIESGDIHFVDRLGGKGPVVTRFREIDLQLRRLTAKGALGLGADARPNPSAGSRQQPGLEIALKTVVDRNGERTDLAVNGKVLLPEGPFDIRNAWFDAVIEAQALPTALLRDYYDRLVPLGAVRGNLAYRLHWEGRPAEGAQLTAEVRFKGLEVEAPSVFRSVIAPGDGRLELVLGWKPQEINIQRLELRTQEISLTAQGSVRFTDGQDPYLELNLSAPSLSLAAARRYLPTKLFESPKLEYLAVAIDRGEIRLTRAGIAGSLSELRRLSEPGYENHLWFDAEVREAGGNLGGDHSLPLRSLGGRIILERGVLYYKGFKGIIGLSRFAEIEAKQTGALSGRGILELRMKGEVELAQLEEQIKRSLLPHSANKMISALQEIGGGGRLDLFVRTDFVSPHHYEGALSLEGARLRIGEVSLSQLKGQVIFSPTEIRTDRATALLAGSPIQLRALLRNYATDQGTFDLTIDSPGIRAGEALRILLSLGSSDGPGTVRGALRYQGSLASADNRRLSGMLELVGAQVPFRFFSQPLREVSGRLRLDGKTLDLQGVQGQMAGYGFSLNGRWISGERPQFVFSLSAPEMDVTYLLPQGESRDDDWYERLQVRGKISLDKGRYEGFSFSDLKMELALDKKTWRIENFFAHSLGGTVQGSGVFLGGRENPRLSVEPKIQGVPLKGFLGWFNIGTSEITGKVNLAGKFDLSGKSGMERKRNLNGAFHLRIEDGVARRFQLLVRLLGFLDLPRWFSLRMPDINQEGISFRSVTADFKVAQGVYATQNLFVDSDDIRITGAGQMDGPKGETDFVIAVRPFPSVENAVNYIPIIGQGLAAIKNSLLVASFNVRGPMEDPSITPAPLSTLSEFLYSALAIPKGVIGLPPDEKQ